MSTMDEKRIEEWSREISQSLGDTDIDYYIEQADQDRHLGRAILRLRMMGEAIESAMADDPDGEFAQAFIRIVEESDHPGRDEILEEYKHLRKD